MKLKDISKSWYFLFSMIIIYLIIYLFNSSLILLSLSFASKIFQNVLPVLTLLFILMSITNRIFDTKTFKEFLLTKKKRTWLIAIIAGILSTGPIYMWYPLLADLRNI